MSNQFRLQEWNLDDDLAEASFNELLFDSLQEAQDYWDNNSIPANFHRTIVYDDNLGNGFKTYQHSVPENDTPPGLKVELEERFYNAFSLEFNGIDTHVDFDDFYDTNSNQLLSVSMWFNATTVDVEQVLVSKKTTGNRGWCLYLDSNNRINFLAEASGGTQYHVRTDTTIQSGQWYNIISLKKDNADALNHEFYLDGISQTFTVIQNNISGGSNTNIHLVMGAHPDITSVFTGFIDQMAISQFAIWNNTDISELYNGGIVPDLGTLNVINQIETWNPIGEGDTFPTISEPVNGFMVGTANNFSGFSTTVK